MKRHAIREHRRTRRRFVRLVTRSALALFVLAAPSTGLANGRYPRAERLVADPADADHMMLAATYGILTTPDRGAHWYHVCEAEFAGDPQYSNDPLLDIVQSGAALVDVQSYIGRSPDGCSWVPTLGSAGATSPTYVDFAVDRATRSTVVAVSTARVDGSVVISLERSQDGGVTWAKIGKPLPLSQVMTIDLDPADATHVMATGLSTSHAGVFLSSPDSGETWTSTPIPNTDDSAFPYIAAVDPHDSNKIYVRTDSWILPDGAAELVAADSLLYSSNGGASWAPVLQATGKLLGFAISPDGSQVVAGYGDPVESGFDVDPDATGIYLASTSDHQFTHVFGGSVTCLTWTADGTYACLAQSASGTLTEVGLFEGGITGPDAGAPRNVMRLADIAGPPPCCAATDAVCSWVEVCPTLGPGACRDGAAPSLACVDAGPDATVTSPDHDSGSSASSSGASSSSSSHSEAGASRPPPTTPSGGSGGCGCRAAPAGAFSPGAVGLATTGMLALVAMRARRRRRQVPGHEAGPGPARTPGHGLVKPRNCKE
jgi:hypothetical protein